MAVRTKNLNNLKRELGKWDLRLRVQQSLVWLPRGLLAGLVVALLVAGAARLWPILPQETVLVLGALLALVGMVAALVVVWLWRRSTLQAARLFDRRFGLKERMSAAVELAMGVLPAESAELANRQYRQAMHTAAGVESARYLPLRMDWREWVVALIALFGLSLAIYLPNPQNEVLAQQAEVEQAITEELEELERLRQEALEEPGLTVEEREAVVETLEEAIQTLEQSGVTQEEALAALDSAERELRDLSEQFAEERQQALQEASGLLAGTAAQEAAKALQEGDLAGAAEALSELDLDSLTPEQQQALAEALGEAAEELAGSDPELAESLGEAAEALGEGDTGSAEANLDEAAESLAEGEGSSTAEVDDLADQVGKGQAGVAGAGKNRPDQPGQGGMGQAPQAQPGEGPGRGSSGAGRGEGDGEAEGGVAGSEMPTDNAPGDGGETPFDEIYSPQRIGGEGGEDVDVPGDPGPGLPTGREGDFVENPAGSSSVPYDEVYGDYSSAVNEAVDGGHVPLGLRDLVRQYFSRLDPE